MQLLICDFETYFDPHYTLKKMKPIQYVRDERFKAHGGGIRLGDSPARWVPGAALPEFFAGLDWDDILFSNHNTAFDGLILVERYGHRPARWADTLGLAKACLPNLPEHDLDTVAMTLGCGVPAKSDILARIKGVDELPPELEAEVAEYACFDADKAHGIHTRLYPILPEAEQDLLHMTVRWSTEAMLEVDDERATAALESEEAERKRLIEASGLTATELRSSKFFPAYVRDTLGIEPPTKLNAKGKEAYAFAKNDLVFQDLIAKTPEHRHIWDAKITAGSTNSVTRTRRIRDIGRAGNRTLPMPLIYYGAHTGRWAGGGGINPQNFKRGSEIRKSIIAPKGYVIVVADSSQIELRMNAWFCNQSDSLEILRRGDDIYCVTAGRFYGHEVTKAEHPEKRGFGKVMELALGYQMGWNKFQTQCALGPMGAAPIYLSDEQAYSAVHTYRTTHAAIKEMWKWLQLQIPLMTHKDYHAEWKCVEFGYEHALLPNGMTLQYNGLDCDPHGEGWSYGHGSRIYGGLFLENLIQGLARIGGAEQLRAIDAEMRSNYGRIPQPKQIKPGIWRMPPVPASSP